MNYLQTNKIRNRVAGRVQRDLWLAAVWFGVLVLRFLSL
jgi:hypothetical protein